MMVAIIGTVQSDVIIPMEEWNTILFLKIKEKKNKKGESIHGVRTLGNRRYFTYHKVRTL
jgi:hypothetical protein